MTCADEQLEQEIERCYQQFLAAKDEQGMRDWMARMRTAIAKRTLGRIREMEQQRGIA